MYGLVSNHLYPNLQTGYGSQWSEFEPSPDEVGTTKQYKKDIASVASLPRNDVGLGLLRRFAPRNDDAAKIVVSIDRVNLYCYTKNFFFSPS